MGRRSPGDSVQLWGGGAGAAGPPSLPWADVTGRPFDPAGLSWAPVPSGHTVQPWCCPLCPATSSLHTSRACVGDAEDPEEGPRRCQGRWPPQTQFPHPPAAPGRDPREVALGHEEGTSWSPGAAVPVSLLRGSGSARSQAGWKRAKTKSETEVATQPHAALNPGREKAFAEGPLGAPFVSALGFPRVFLRKARSLPRASACCSWKPRPEPTTR